MDGQRFKQIDHLMPGTRVRVIRTFQDANGHVYREGEEFVFEYVTLRGPKLLPTLHGPGIEIPLNGVEPRKGRLREYFAVPGEDKKQPVPPAPKLPVAQPAASSVPRPANPPPIQIAKMDWDLYKLAIQHAAALADSGDLAAATEYLGQIDKMPFPAECPRDSQIAHDLQRCELSTEAGRAWQMEQVEDLYGSYVAGSTSGGEAAARLSEVRQWLGKR
ncbi:MAG: DUF3601 domain-containing protein [Acidobacteria bacterium]|nr:DUF3601 domain-containing protein [Acidobacteriota bacterium]